MVLAPLFWLGSRRELSPGSGQLPGQGEAMEAMIAITTVMAIMAPKT